MPFSYKVTARNLFRYKKRMFMTIVGVSDCTALLLIGFGLKNSISSVLTKQYGEVYQYDMILGIEKDADWQQVVSDLEDLEGIEGIMPLETKSAESRNGEKTADVQLYVVPDAEQVHSFVNLRECIFRDPVILDQNSVLLTEKLSVKLSLKVGDTLQIEDAHGRFQELTVGGIVEHYVNDFVYITQDLYTALLADEWKPNEMVVYLDGTVEEEVVMQEIRDTSNDITTIQNIDDLTVTMRAVMESLNSVIVVIILVAGLLAFIVLYNLTNINIMERKREIATIKVLGFYHGEVNSYIYRETTVLTLIGSIFGLALGVVLHRFVIQTVEVDRVMFTRTIETMSYVSSAMLTLAFSVIINLIMYRKLKKISMVESLKSVD